MAIPSFDKDGLLPPGIHDCSINEIQQRLGAFRRSDRRCRLYERLENYLADLQSAAVAVAVIVDGSFATAKDEPNDIDLIVVLRAGHDYHATLRPFSYNLLSRRQVQKQFGIDLLLAEDGRPELSEYLSFFQQVRNQPELRKGLFRLFDFH